MKKRGKKTELLTMAWIGFFQLLTFYLLPLFAGPVDAMGMVFLLIFITFALSAFLGAASGGTVKFLYPIATAVFFIPSVYIYYNESALIHSLWYFVISFAGIGMGVLIRKLMKYF